MRKILSMALFSDPRTQGGIETFNRNLINFFKNEICVITEKNKKQKLYAISNVIEIGSYNILFRILNNRILKNKLKEFLVRKKVIEIGAEIIIFSFPYEAFLLKNIESKKIIVQHTSYEHFVRSYCQEKKIYIENLEKTVDYWVLLSPYDKEKFQKNFNLREEQIKVIRHTCEMELLKSKKVKNKKLIMIGRIDNSSKRFDLAIRAMKKLPEFTLDIYGDNYNQKDMDFLQEIIEEEKIINVNFKGVTNKVQEKLDESGIFIMTSDYEGYGIVNIEAMRRGLPIILRNTFDSARDIVIDNGILLEKEWNEDKFVEALKKVYDNYEYYSENSKRLGERHSPEAIKKEWDKLFKEIEIGKRK